MSQCGLRNCRQTSGTFVNCHLSHGAKPFLMSGYIISALTAIVSNDRGAYTQILLWSRFRKSKDQLRRNVSPKSGHLRKDSGFPWSSIEIMMVDINMVDLKCQWPSKIISFFHFLNQILKARRIISLCSKPWIKALLALNKMQEFSKSTETERTVLFLLYCTSIGEEPMVNTLIWG